MLLTQEIKRLITDGIEAFITSIPHFENLSSNERIDLFSLFIDEHVNCKRFDHTLINYSFQIASLKNPQDTLNYLKDSSIEGKYLRKGNLFELERFNKEKLMNKYILTNELQEIESGFSI